MSYRYGVTYEGSGDQWIDASGTLDTAWHHYAIVTDSGMTQLYIDGQHQGGAALATIHDSSLLLTIGGVLSTTGHGGPVDPGLQSLLGRMDDVVIWDVALSESDIVELSAADCWNGAW